MISGTSKPVILNVDDHEMSRYALTRTLELNHFQVREAANGSEALRLARAEQPDLILLDVNLPDISGFDVCRQLKAEPATARIPILHLTASSMEAPDYVRGLEGGADSYLMEPVEPEVLVATINSILRARRAEEEAQRLAREWQSTFDAIQDGVAVVNREGRIQRLNESLSRLSGKSVGDLTGQLCYEIWGIPEAQRSPFLRATKSRQRETAELTFDSKRLSVTADPIVDEKGTVAGAVYLVRDDTERQRLEEQFRESQKFETIGTLAAGVAHDYNNLLTSIMGNASLMLVEQAGNADTRERLQEIMRASQRAADLTKQLLAYSGRGRHYLQKVEISQVVRDTQKLIESVVPKRVQLEMELASGLPAVEADLNQIQQVILNLVSNAAEAIGEESGAITLVTGSSGDDVYLEVRDTGCGMDAETRARMFDPFFTTKFTGRGLGLSAVAGIARGHGGTIQVTSSPGNGCTFRLSLPPAAQVMPQPAPESDAAARVVLVVDDEDMVRRIAQASLEHRGYHVLTATNGLEAIQRVRKHPEIALVLLDLTMPVMGGEEAIDEILAAHPGIRVIVSTGYDQREAATKFARKPVVGILGKPYTSRQLAEAVESVMGKPRPAGPVTN